MYKFSSRAMRAYVLAAGSALFLTAAPLGPQATSALAADMTPAEVDANYKITLNGFELGTFRFNSDVARDHYALNTDVELSALLGVFHWKGVTRSSGTLVAAKPQPAGFLFEFESSAKSGSVKMGFGQYGNLQSVSVAPEAIDPPDTIPLTPEHLKGVLDPLSAILVLTHVDAPSPCGRKVPIFDGKQRFDIDLKYARTEPVAGQPNEMAIVCRVKYTPIGGYRPTEETMALASSKEIEIAFRPVPQAKLMLPQSIVIPTVIGRAELTLVQVGIKTEGGGKLASVN
jgi:uncharacterized protein DUF3108